VADLLDALVRGDVPALCQTAAGDLTPTAPPPPALLCGSFNPLHDGHMRLAEVAEARLHVPVAFELGVVNAAKPPLTSDEVRRRVAQFVGRRDVWLTREPTFLGKSALFPRTTFVVGFDTAERIVAPRFYGGPDGMLAALWAMRERGVRFLVAGRVDAIGRFQTADALVVPDGFRDLFAAVSEAEFRADIASTTIRNSGQ
jgi:hypothetical protein